MSSTSVKRKFEWIVDNVTRDKLENTKLKVFSDVIFINIGGNKTEWKTLFQSKKDNEVYSVGVYLKCIKSDKYDFMVRWSFQSNDIVKSYEVKSELFKDHSRGSRPFLTLDDLFDPSLKHVVESRFRLIVEVELTSQDSKEIVMNRGSPFSKYYSDHGLADFTLKSSDDKEFQVHRLILSDRSSFFKKMFTVDMKEKKVGWVKFEDIDSKVLGEVLKFIYTGNVEALDNEMTKNILYAAEKFNIPSLKSSCVDRLMKEVKQENVLDIFLAADLFHAGYLEEKCLQIIIDNFKQLKGTADWKQLNADLLTKIIDAFATLRENPQFTLKTTL